MLSKNMKIIMYHGVVDNDSGIDCWWLLKRSQFEKQVRYLRKHYKVISIDEAVDNLSRPGLNFRDNVVLTFDDGYKNYLTNAYPILKKHNLPSTIYITAGKVQSNELIWADQLFYLLTGNNGDRLNIESLGLGMIDNVDHKGREHIAHDFINRLKTLPSSEKNRRINTFMSDNNLSPSSDVFKGSPFEVLSAEDLRLLAQDKLVTIGSHTVNHEILTQVPFQEAEREIGESKRMLEEFVGRPIHHFSYPNGNYNDELAEQVRNYGYLSAVTTCYDDILLGDPFRMGRLGVGAFDSFFFFYCRLTCVFPLL